MWQLLSLKSRRITMKLCAAGLVLRSFWEHVRSTLFSSWASLQCFQVNKIPSIEPLPNFYWQFCQWWKDKNFWVFWGEWMRGVRLLSKLCFAMKMHQMTKSGKCRGSLEASSHLLSRTNEPFGTHATRGCSFQMPWELLGLLGLLILT